MVEALAHCPKGLPDFNAFLRRSGLRYRVPQDTEGKMPANFVLLLAIGLALVSSSAGAQAPCDAAALNGRYVFTGRGFIEAVQPGIEGDVPEARLMGRPLV